MTPEQIARAAWVANSPSTMILKCRVKDGGAVLATITTINFFNHAWRAGELTGRAKSRYAAARQVRKALRENAE